MTTATGPGLAPAERPTHRPGVFVSWSGPVARDIAAALQTLIAASFHNRVDVWQRGDDADRLDDDTALQLRRANAIVLVVTPETAGSPRLMHDAGAFTGVHGATFALGDGVDAAALRRTPVCAVPVADAANERAVRDLVRAVGKAIGERPGDFDALFAHAWPPFHGVLDGLRIRARAEAASRRWTATVIATLIAVALLVGVPWFGGFWPYAQPPQPCQDLRGDARANCGWQQFLARHTTRGSGGNVDLAAQLTHRPFAIVERRTGCGAGSTVDEHHLVTQGDAVHGARVRVLFAAPAELPAAPVPALAVTIGTTTTVLAPWACAGDARGAIRPRFIGTLSPTDVCTSLRRLRGALPDRLGTQDAAGPVSRLVDLLSAYLASSGAASPIEIHGRLDHWVALCGIR